ncbi:MAG: thiolase family protein [Candidatus Omnitrophica bacterium]|nr:thiolase family protein [Candidatus Omnitrophota bacterium]
MREDVYIIDNLRTPVGSRNKILKNFTAVQLAAHILEGLMSRQNIDPALIDEVIMGNVVGAGAGQNLARQASYMAGLPDHILSYTVNHVCGSGLMALSMGMRSILSGSGDYIFAGGTESVTHSPQLLLPSNEEPQDSAFVDGLYCSMTHKSMGELAEELCQRHQISRAQQDQFALRSHQKAVRARPSFFPEEIYPLIGDKSIVVACDDRPRLNLTLERLGLLPPVFTRTGTITAATACTPADGAAMLSIASEDFVQSNKLKPKAKILGFTPIMVNPAVTFESDTSAIERCLKQCQLELKDIDLFEITEAFAANVILTQQILSIPDEKLNVFGGDLALGHPLGIAGTRVLVSLINALQTRKLNKGLACISFGGGGAIAVIIESCLS